MTTTPTSGAADLPEALRSIQRFEVVDCIDDKHVPAVIPKPHGPWVRYADHVTALAAWQATAAPQGVAYAALPEKYYLARGEVPTWDAKQMHAFADATHTLRASHGQASSQAGEYPALVCDYCGALTPDPWHSSGMLHGKMSKHIHSCDACCRGAAQAAPAYKDSTPELHIGDSAFESWYSTYSPVHKSDKQRARDAYAAGMGDPLVTAAPKQEAQSALFDKQGFHEWVLLNLPYDTIIGNSAYWADHLSKGIQRFVKAAPQPSPAAQGDAMESEYQRGYRQGYEQRDAEVRGALV